MVSYPVDLQATVLPKLWISYLACHKFSVFSGAKIVFFDHKSGCFTTMGLFLTQLDKFAIDYLSDKGNFAPEKHY